MNGYGVVRPVESLRCHAAQWRIELIAIIFNSMPPMIAAKDLVELFNNCHFHKTLLKFFALSLTTSWIYVLQI